MTHSILVILCLFVRTTYETERKEMDSRIQIIETEREVLRVQVSKLKTVNQEKQQV